MPELMVWPPPKVLASPEGEVTVERPREGAPDTTSAVAGNPSDTTHSVPVASPVPLGAALPGATVSIMAATSVPRDWLERPEGLLGCVLGTRYRITTVIGRGPMGIACEGESSRGRQVTLKLLPRAPELPVEHFAWQVRQALALAHFDHPNVMPINDFGALDDGSAFVSRARVPGVTLRTVLRQGGLPIPRALDIARQIAAALGAAHAQDIAHGRLKPENVILQGGPRPGDLVRVIDFGMAGLPVNLRAVAPSENEALRLALRTRLYLPADVTGASPAIDVYSLGVMLFEMIAGQPPFVFESLPPAGQQQAPLSFAQCNPALVVPASVTELVFALLHPRAAEHGLSAERIGSMLDSLLQRPSVAAPPEAVTRERPSLEHSAARGLDAALARAGSDSQPPTAMGASLVWPASPAPAPDRTHSFPPLPRGFTPSSFPPPALERIARDPESLTPQTPPPSAPPPSKRTSGAPYPTPPSARRSASLADEPFSTASFPPPSVNVPQAAAVPSFSLPPQTAPGADEQEMELRPSFIGRLKRLFGKKPPDEF